MANYVNDVVASGRIGRIWKSSNGQQGAFTLTVVTKSKVNHVRFTCNAALLEGVTNGAKVRVVGYIRSYKRNEKYEQGFVATEIRVKKSVMESGFGKEIASKLDRPYYYAPDSFLIAVSGHVAGKIDSGEKFGKIILHTENVERPDFANTVLLSYFKNSDHRPAFDDIKVGDKMYAACSVYTPDNEQSGTGRYYEDVSVEDAYFERS